MPKTVPLYLQWAAIVGYLLVVAGLAYTGHPIDAGTAAAMVGGVLGLSAKAVTTMTSAANAVGGDAKTIVAAMPAAPAAPHVDASAIELAVTKAVTAALAAKVSA